MMPDIFKTDGGMTGELGSMRGQVANSKSFSVGTKITEPSPINAEWNKRIREIKTESISSHIQQTEILFFTMND